MQSQALVKQAQMIPDQRMVMLLKEANANTTKALCKPSEGSEC